MKLYQKLLYVLADPSVKEGDFRRVMEYLREHTKDFIDNAHDLRRQMLHFDVAMDDDRARRPSHTTESSGSTARATFRRLLCEEANLEPKEAIKQVATRLKKGGFLVTPFTRAMEALFDEFGEAKVLSIAQQVRNEVVHGRVAPNWPLTGGGSEAR